MRRWRLHLFKILKFVIVLSILLVVGLYAALTYLLGIGPRSITSSERLRSFPTVHSSLERKVSIYWNNFQVPFIEAENDRDLAYALGLVHAHLRLGQMQVMRRVSQGRISEMAGPFTRGIDQALRTLDFGYAADGILASMPSETREFLSRYVEGINAYVKDMPAKAVPYEFRVFGLEREPWSVRDIIVLSRLLGTEINWLYWFRLLGLMAEPHWPEFWKRLEGLHSNSTVSFEPYGRHSVDGPLSFLAGLSKSGSNSIVVSGKHSHGGAGLIASDPHVGFQLPNLWVVVGMKSPSYHALGLQFPGIPAVLVGRNERIAWGGTNMLSLTSSLFRISEQDVRALRIKEDRIRTRWWFTKDFRKQLLPLSESLLVPVISDIPQLREIVSEPLGLRWVGYEASDEITTLLSMNRATSFDEFRKAFKTYAVSGQNFLYTDVEGNIGQVLAVKKPVIKDTFEDGFISATKPEWNEFLGATELPFAYNPEQGFLVSGNNRPFVGVEPRERTSLFYASSDRVEQLQNLLSENVAEAHKVTVQDLHGMQMDVFSPSAFRVKELIKEIFDDLQARANFRKEALALIDLIGNWDGNYAVESKGAVAFHLFSYYFVKSYYGEQYGEAIASYIAGSDSVYWYVEEDIAQQRERVLVFIEPAIKKAAEKISDYENWGDMHRLKVQGVLGNLPVFGGRFRVDELRVPGSSSTVFKTFSGLSDERQYARYGANARHVSDLSDPNENYFVLLGGQDGFLGSQNYADQVQLWLSGSYVRVPFEMEEVRKQATVTTILER